MRDRTVAERTVETAHREAYPEVEERPARELERPGHGIEPALRPERVIREHLAVGPDHRDRRRGNEHGHHEVVREATSDRVVGRPDAPPIGAEDAVAVRHRVKRAPPEELPELS